MAYRNGGSSARRQQHEGRAGSDRSTLALAQGLGWFSIGLGLAELLAPRSLARFLGMEQHTGLIRAYGAREVATGVGILTAADPTPWIWGRVGGDVLDLATLATGFSDDNRRKGDVGLALSAVAGVTLLDLYCAQALRAGSGARQQRYAAVVPDYSDRSGLPRPPEAMKGAAREGGFEVPRDMRIPELLRTYAGGGSETRPAAAG